MTIMRCTAWPSNAELIADVASLGHIRGAVLDPTYGRGRWWKTYRPENLVTRDRKTDPSWDFRTMAEFADETFDCVAFDPPYVAVGGRKTIGAKVKDFTDSYGMDTAERDPKAVQEAINDGMAQSARVLKPGGILLVKCSDYISSGELWPGTHFTWVWATIQIGFEHVDTFIHLSKSGGPQPKDRTRADGKPVRQHHARSNSSVLFVFRRPK